MNPNNYYPVVLSYGMGWDSTAILLRWLEDPSSRDFNLSNLVVLSAQTGEEFSDTQQLVETHILPRLRSYQIRYVQVARAGASQSEGIVTLSDTRQPTACHTPGQYRLSQELLAAGTVPQYASGKRRCSLKFKGFPLDTWLKQEFGERPFRHVMGFNTDEMRRVERDKSYSTEQRRSEYPLVEWGWGRQRLEDYTTLIIGKPFQKSCCVMCPFAGGKAPVLKRYRIFPEAGAFAMFIEHISLALNPRMSLFYGSKTVREAVAGEGNEQALYLADKLVQNCEWALYRVRRIYAARGRADRKVEKIECGPREDMLFLLDAYATSLDRNVVWERQSPRLYLRHRGAEYPALEDFYVSAPARPRDKGRGYFERKWGELTGGENIIEFSRMPQQVAAGYCAPV